jgi:hypothetical protein
MTCCRSQFLVARVDAVVITESAVALHRDAVAGVDLGGIGESRLL